MQGQQSTWHVNMKNMHGKIVSISPVAVRIEFANSAQHTFSISRNEYEQLRNLGGERISFDVQHNVLQTTAMY